MYLINAFVLGFRYQIPLKYFLTGVRTADRQDTLHYITCFSLIFPDVFNGGLIVADRFPCDPPEPMSILVLRLPKANWTRTRSRRKIY